MSGICGLLRLDGENVARADLDRQMVRLAHLGRDRSSIRIAGPIGLGHLMMRVTAEDRHDAQPLNEDGVTLVADPRLDNRGELAAALAINPAFLSGMPDSSLLLAAYRKWGCDCVDHLLGDFAFAIWDARVKTLTLARDHMGQRQLFYHAGTGFFAFATQVKGLWALPQVPRALSEERFVRALMLQKPATPGSTLYEGIRSLPGGTLLTVTSSGTVTERRYWEPQADPRHVGRDESYYVETYRTTLAEAVACRLRRTTSPAGIFMSGGFDSSAICALAGPVVTAQGRKLVAVSSVMPDDYRGSIRHARRWVEACRRVMPHLDVRYVTREGLDILEGMQAAFLHLDGGHNASHYVHDAIFSEIARAGARVVMDGHGGDYTLNPRAPDALVHFLRKGQFRRFVTEFNAMRWHLGQSARQTMVRNVVMPALAQSRIRVLGRYLAGTRRSGWNLPLSQQVASDTGAGADSVLYRPPGEGMRQRMERVLRMQQASLAPATAAARHGLECTRPFLDKRVVELALAIPEGLYVKTGRSRYLARVALGSLYPPEFHDRPPGNDDLVPDFLAMAKRIEPEVLAEIARMEKTGRLSAIFDFPRMRAMFSRRAVDEHASGNEYDTRQALYAFISARFLEWFRRDNA
jgi:asparagine synthase (glutamine-hydrolysing)